MSKNIVQRVWQEAELRPHRLACYMASNDPDFETKAADIIALYLDPPRHAAVFCIDEKTAIQALDHRDRVLPLSPGRVERRGFDYKRYGTLQLQLRRAGHLDFLVELHPNHDRLAQTIGLSVDRRLVEPHVRHRVRSGAAAT